MSSIYALVPNMVPRSVWQPVLRLLMPHVGEIDASGHFPGVVRADYMRHAAKEIGAHPLVQRILGSSRLRCHWPPMARCVRPGDDNAQWPMHRDTKYNGHLAGEFITVWVPLVAIDAACGGLRTPDRALSPLMAGDGVILGHECEHASEPNRSDRARISCDFRFFTERTRSTKHYLNLTSGEVVEP